MSSPKCKLYDEFEYLFNEIVKKDNTDIFLMNQIDELLVQSLLIKKLTLFLKANYLKYLILIYNKREHELFPLQNQIINQIKATNNKYLLAKSYYFFAMALVKYRNYAQGDFYFKKALQISEKMNYYNLHSMSLRKTALIAIKQNDFISAYNSLIKGLNLAKENNIFKEIALINYEMSLIMIKLHNYDKASEFLIDSNKILLKFPYKKQIILNNIRLSQIYLKLDKPDFASNALTKCKITIQEFNNCKIQYSYKYSLAQLKYSQKEYSEAISLLKDCLLMKKRISLLDIGRATLLISDSYLQIDNITKAINILHYAVKICKNKSDKSITAELYLKLANLYLLENNFELLMKQIEKSIKLNYKYSLNIDDRINLLLYNLNKRQNNPEFALSYLKKYMDIFIQNQNNRLKQNLDKLNTQFQLDQLKLKYETDLELEKANTAFALAVTANHEINQPLMIIQGNLDIIYHKLEAGNMNDTQKIILEKSFSEIDTLSKVLSDFRNYTQNLIQTNNRQNEIVIE